MKFPILYHKAKDNSIRIWEIWTEDNVIFTKHGHQDGKQQISEKKSEGKNIGRSNETTPAEQAALEAESIWKKKTDKGYKENPDDLDDFKPLPMLAKKLDDKRKAKLEYPVWVQPKLDGVRAFIQVFPGQPVKITSRNGKVYDIPHISDAIPTDNIPGDGYILDGEVYVHGMTFQQVVRLVKKNRPESIQLQFHMYDYILVDDETDYTQRARMRQSAKWFLEHSVEDDFPVVETVSVIAENEAEIYEAHKKFIAEGYEGSIVRTNDNIYQFGFRSNGLLKLKDFLDDEFKIVGYSNGIGKFEDCVIWRCVTKEGKEFNVTPKGTFEERKQFLTDADQYVGQFLTVRYFEETEDNIPRFPVGVGVRLSQDM